MHALSCMITTTRFCIVSLAYRGRCLRGLWSCWRLNVSYRSGYRSSASSSALVGASSYLGLSSRSCSSASTCISSSPTTFIIMSPSPRLATEPTSRSTAIFTSSFSTSSSVHALFFFHGSPRWTLSLIKAGVLHRSLVLDRLSISKTARRGRGLNNYWKRFMSTSLTRIKRI